VRNPFYRFLVLGTTLFSGWYFLYEFYLRDHTLLDEMVIHNLVEVSSAVLRAMGYELTEYPLTPYLNHVGIAGAPGVMIGAPCDGLVLFALFVVFVVAFPGKWKHRMWFIPSGIALIHGLNALRIVGLTVLISWKREWLSFNHDYTFTVLVYAVVFALWWIWVRHLSGLRAPNSAPK
jgi:exosortase family protein XrtF